MKFFCAITDGPINGPTSDAFIEWYWAIQYPAVASLPFITGKLTYVGNYSNILAQYKANGNQWFNTSGIGPGQFGIPLFNPSNHNS